ncbi:MAG: C40 family peptidase [Muribaculum sp.]|nr:C40 family peptidase [Muribaculum sp.]
MLIRINILIITILLFVSAISISAQDSCWVQVRIPVACIRDGKGHATEMTSQSIMGTPMLVLEHDGGEWLKLQGPDGYEGYMNISSVTKLSHTDMLKWRDSPRLVSVSLPEIKVYSSETDKCARTVVTELVNGSILEGILSDGPMTKVTLPDGRSGWVETSSMMPAEEWASQPFDANDILTTCYWLMGTPYLWGGCTTKSTDCSGLVRISYFANGILMLRDARQQIEIGKHIDIEDINSLEAADLLFFSGTPDGRISHVAIYDNDGKYIHSSGLVKTNHMKYDDPDFSNRVYRGASRINGMIPSDGIIQMINHPWYFK